MARILIFDNTATVDDAGNDVEMGPTVQNQWRTSQAVRCHGGQSGDQRNISYELVVDSDAGYNTTIEWYQEFFNDHPWVNLTTEVLRPYFNYTATTQPAAMPSTRVFPASTGEYPWAREQVAIAGAAGIINHFNIVRTVTNAGGEARPSADCRYYPMLVHTLWTRIKLRATDAGAQIGDEYVYPRIRMYAHIGGLGELAEFTERQLLPFSWAPDYGFSDED